MRESFRLLGALGGGILGFLAFSLLVPRDNSFGMFEAESGRATAMLAIAFVCTIAGVLLGAGYRAVLRLKSQGVEEIEDFAGFLGGLLRSVDLWLGLLAAPIVFALLLKASDGMELSGLVVVALQNGFCAQLIVQGLVKQTEQPG